MHFVIENLSVEKTSEKVTRIKRNRKILYHLKQLKFRLLNETGNVQYDLVIAQKSINTPVESN